MASSPIQIPALEPNQQRIAILGAGIVGSALAYYLSTRLPSSQIILLDPSPNSSAGSTTIAPGLVGQLNIIPYLTAMAKEAVEAYSKIPDGFQKTGGLEIARTKEGIAELNRRMELAKGCGLEAEILTSLEVAQIAPDFHAEDESSIGLFFAGDGTANPPLIVAHYQEQVRARGVVIVAAKLSAISVGKGEKITLTTDQGAFEADRVILATGIWTPALLKTLGIDIPIIPVAHPYAHGPSRVKREIQQPFVRWPERHVYARNHGGFDGFGSYAHEPLPCSLGESALFEDGPFLNIFESALSVFPPSLQHTKAPYKPFNGIFALTPDSMPLAGAVPQIPGLYVAAALWITHAAGVTRLIADIVAGTELSDDDKALRNAFDPMRFQGADAEVLRKKALGTYNDIYNKEKH